MRGSDVNFFVHTKLDYKSHWNLNCKEKVKPRIKIHILVKFSAWKTLDCYSLSLKKFQLVLRLKNI